MRVSENVLGIGEDREDPTRGVDGQGLNGPLIVALQESVELAVRVHSDGNRIAPVLSLHQGEHVPGGVDGYGPVSPGVGSADKGLGGVIRASAGHLSIYLT